MSSSFRLVQFQNLNDNAFWGNSLYDYQALHLTSSVVPKRYKLPAGSFLSIAAIAGSVSTTVLSALQTKMTDTRAKLQTADPAIIDTLTRESLLGDMFHAGSLGYYSQYIAMSYLAGLQSGAHHVLAGGTGSFGYEPEVNYFFGTPRSLTSGGIALNKPILNIVGTDTPDAIKKKSYVTQIGMMSSALEHITPEQMFTDANNPGEAVSAIKAMQLASSQGQRIYQITRQNQSVTLPNIKHDSATMEEISNALNSGKEVITHTDAIQVPGWSGAGYIIIDSETGSGAYKIAGGGNGSYLTGLFIGMMLVTAITIAISTTGGLALPLLASVLAHAGIFSGINAALSGGIDAKCFWAGLLGGLTPVFLLAAPLFGSAQAAAGTIAGLLGYTEAALDITETRKECFGASKP